MAPDERKRAAPGHLARSWPMLITKRHTEALQQCIALRVIERAGHDRHFHATDFIYLIVVNLGKDDLLAQAQRIVAAPIE